MRIAPTASELTVLRSPKQWSHTYVAVHRPQTLFSARLASLPASYPAATLAFSSGTPTSGTVPAGATIYIGSSAGARDKGTLRLRADLTKAASGSLSVSELGEKLINLAANDYLTVVEDYRPAAKFPRYSGGAWQMDYAIAYDPTTSKQNENYGPLARLGPAAVGFLVGGHCHLKYIGERSAAFSPSNALDTWAWSFPDGSSSASQGTTASPIDVDYTAAIPNGQYHSLTVTEDTTNKTHIGRRLTFVFERTGANAPYAAVLIGTPQGGPGQGGYSAELKIVNTAASQTDFPDGAHVVIFTEDHYATDDGEYWRMYDATGTFTATRVVTGATSGATGTVVALLSTEFVQIKTTSGEFIPGESITEATSGYTATIECPNIGGNFPRRGNVLMEGWIVGETVRKNPETGEITFSVTTLDGVLRTIEGYPVALTNRSQATPTVSWEDFHLLTMNTATLHFVLWRSTIADICDVEFQEYASPDTAIIKYVTLDKASLFDQISGFWQGTMLGWVACDLQGALYCEMDAVIDDTVRANMVSLFTIAPATDLRDELEIQRHIIDDNSQTALYAVAYKKPLGSKSPGDPHGYAGMTTEITAGVAGPLVGGDTGVPDQATLNLWAGNLRAKANNTYRDIIHRMFGNWRIDPVPQSYFTETISSGDTLRGITLTAVKMIPRALALRYNERSYSLLADVTCDRETTGLGGVAITFQPVENPPIEVPPIDPVDPPIVPQPESNGSAVWLGHENAAATPARAIIYSDDFFSNPGSPTYHAVSSLPADLAEITFIQTSTYGDYLYIVGTDTDGHGAIWEATTPKGTPSWTKKIAYNDLISDVTDPYGVRYQFYYNGAAIGFDRSNNYPRFKILAQSVPMTSAFLVEFNGATMRISGGSGKYKIGSYYVDRNPYGLWEEPHTIIGGFTVSTLSGWSYLPDAQGSYHATPTGFQVGSMCATSSLYDVISSVYLKKLSTFGNTWTAVATCQNDNGYGYFSSPTAQSNSIYVLQTPDGNGPFQVVYSEDGAAFYASTQRAVGGAAILRSGKLQGGRYIVASMGNDALGTVVNGNVPIRHCADVADETTYPWTDDTGNMWSGGSPIITAGNLIIKNMTVTYLSN